MSQYFFIDVIENLYKTNAIKRGSFVSNNKTTSPNPGPVFEGAVIESKSQSDITDFAINNNLKCGQIDT